MYELNCDVAVIGAGPAGLAAALAAREYGAASVVLLDRDDRLGGILNQCIHPGFGLHHFGQELTGPEYARRFIEPLAQSDIQVFLETMVLQIDSGPILYAINPQQGLMAVKPKALILAMGCRERARGALAIPGTRPAGIYSAGTAQRLINLEGQMPGKQAVILGSGDIGLIMARRMAYEGAKVEAVCELMPYSSGLPRNIAQCLDDLNIPLLLSHTVVEIHGQQRLEAVTIARVDAALKPISGTQKRIACDTLLLSVGLIPENELSLEASLEMDSLTGGPLVDHTFATSQPGIYACGNGLHVHDLVDFVTKEAQLAGKQAARFAQGLASPLPTLPCMPADRVAYVLPQRLSPCDETADLCFRVKAPMGASVFQAVQGDRVLAEKKKTVSTPGEMDTLPLPLSTLQADGGPVMFRVLEVSS